MRPELLAADAAVTYRKPIPVNEICVYRNRETYPRCPRCHMTLEREYQAYCDRCGQALDWSEFHKALIVLNL